MSDSPAGGAASRRKFLAQAAAVVSVAVVPLPIAATPAATALGWQKQDTRPGEEPPKSPEPTRTSDRATPTPGVSPSQSAPRASLSHSSSRVLPPSASASRSSTVVSPTPAPVRDRAIEQQRQERTAPRKGVEFF